MSAEIQTEQISNPKTPFNPPVISRYQAENGDQPPKVTIYFTHDNPDLCKPKGCEAVLIKTLSLTNKDYIEAFCRFCGETFQINLGVIRSIYEAHRKNS